MSSQLVAAMPCSVWSSRVASTIRRRVSATVDALRLMSYFRGDISLTNILRRRHALLRAGRPPAGARPGDGLSPAPAERALERERWAEARTLTARWR
jgi:hypothetical protein